MASESLYDALTTPDIERNLLLQSKYIVWSITLSYILFTKVIGPNMMKNRKPMDLQLTMLLYNLFLVACNAYLSAHVTKLAVEMWPYRCNFQKSSIYTDTSRYFTLAWIALFVKFLELFDTVIFILRKKFQQVSFLHVFHHTIVFTMLWICMKFKLASFYVLLIGSINFGIHVALYLYYALSALGPSVRKYLWWKKYLTRVQIVQFFVIMTYMGYSGITGCDKYNSFDIVVFTGTAIIAALFLNFYIRSYNKTKKTS